MLRQPAFSICRRIGNLIAAFLLLLALAAPAQACFPWCVFGTRQPDSPQAMPLQRPAMQQAGIELAVRPAATPARSAFGIDEAEIRRAFDIAYGGQMFASGAAREAAYRSWKATIKRPDEDEDVRIYHSNMSPEHDIDAMLDLNSGQLSFEIVSSDKVYAQSLGVALGLERDRGAGLFARAYVALGGRQSVRSLRARWIGDSSDNLRTFNSELGLGRDRLTAANATFTGKMAKRFYGFTAVDVQSDVFGNQTVIFAPPPQDFRGAGVGLGLPVIHEAPEEKQELLR